MQNLLIIQTHSQSRYAATSIYLILLAIKDPTLIISPFNRARSPKHHLIINWVLLDATSKVFAMKEVQALGIGGN